MILDNFVKININSSKLIYKLNNLGINSRIGDIITLEISKLWKGSNLKVNVKCDICGQEKKIQFNAYNKNITKYCIYSCSNSCSYFKNKLTCIEKYGLDNFNNVEKSKRTKLEKYGSENYQNIDKIKKTKLEKYGSLSYNNSEAAKLTNLKKYGVSCTLQNENIVEKTKKTNLEKYGMEDSRSSNKVIEKRIKTNLERYGVKYYTQSDDFWKKVKETSLIKYGVYSPNQSEDIKRKKFLSMIDKYGFINNSLTPKSKEKLKKTNLEKYGVEYPMQVLEFAEKQQKNTKKIIKYNDRLYYQGTYEKDFLNHVSSLNIIDDVKRGPVIRYNLNEFNKIYYPDFYLEKYNLIVEIKSSYYYNKYLEKNILKKEKCIKDGYNFIFIIDKNYYTFNLIIDILNQYIQYEF